jgi:hypothetical protein
MSEIKAPRKFKDKFVAFVDVLGFKTMVEAAELAERTGASDALEGLFALLAKLGTPHDAMGYFIDGPIFCPESRRVQRGMDFQITQISDCVVVSAEISPAGIISLVGHCWSVVTKLLQDGVMCRGYVTRGSVYHIPTQVIGLAYQRAFKLESQVAAFRQHSGERGTPFVEIDEVVVQYIQTDGCACVKEMFSRMTLSDGSVVGLFPFKQLQTSFPLENLDRHKELRANAIVRQSLVTLKQRVLAAVSRGNASAVQKAEHYARALDAQLEICDSTDEYLRRGLSGI